MQQPGHDRHVHQIKAEAVQERRPVGAGEVENPSRHPAAERHAEQRRHQDDTEARAGFARREIFAHDDGVARHDATLEQAEQRRDHVKRNEPVEPEIEEQSGALQHRTEQQRAHAADAVGDEARGNPADDAEAEHHREHLGATRDAVTEIAAIGDDMDLRHRHRYATGHAGDAQQHLQRHRRERRLGLTPRGCRAGGVAMMILDAPPQQEHQRQHGNKAEQADADMGRAPAVGGNEMLHHRRPDRAGEIISGGGDRDRDAAPAHEPMRDVGHQRAEARRAAKPDQPMRERDLPQARRHSGRQIAGR